MTREEYGSAYEKGFQLTVRFLLSRGIPYNFAEETAQAAWVRGWEQLAQLRDSTVVHTWMNTIALNIYRTRLRREPFVPLRPELPQFSTPAEANVAAIEVHQILRICKLRDRIVLQDFYLQECKIQEIARTHGWTELAIRVRICRARRSIAERLRLVRRD